MIIKEKDKMRFEYTEIADKNKQVSYGVFGCNVCCFIVIMSICASFNIAGLCVGAVNQNATCYEHKNIITLSSWLILKDSVAVVIVLMFIMSLVIAPCGEIGRMCSVCGIVGTVLLWWASGIFYFIMTIIGIVELTYQYPTCNTEVSSVCTMVIISIVISLIAICSTKNGNKQQERTPDDF